MKEIVSLRKLPPAVTAMTPGFHRRESTTWIIPAKDATLPANEKQQI
jgi:hypothetical protein